MITDWWLTLFSRHFKADVVGRLWDQFLLEVRNCAAGPVRAAWLAPVWAFPPPARRCQGVCEAKKCPFIEVDAETRDVWCGVRGQGEPLLFRVAVAVFKLLAGKLMGEALEVCMRVIAHVGESLTQEDLFQGLARVNADVKSIRLLIDPACEAGSSGA